MLGLGLNNTYFHYTYIVPQNNSYVKFTGQAFAYLNAQPYASRLIAP